MKTLRPSTIFAWYFLLIAALTITNSCKKDHQLVNADLTADQTAFKMQEWLNAQKSDSLTAANLLKQANWKTAHAVTADSGKTYQIVDLNTVDNFTDTSKVEKRYLVISIQGGNTSGYIYDLFGNNAEIAGKADAAITEFESNQITDFSGEISLSTWKNKISKVKTFENGNNTTTKVLIGRQAKKIIQSSKSYALSCTDWYWVYSRDGIVFYEEYAFTTCTNDDAECSSSYRDLTGALKFKTNCSPGSGDSGDHGGAPDTAALVRLPHPGKLPPSIGYYTQPGQTCVFMVLEYLKDYLGGTATFSSTTQYYAAAHNTTQAQLVANGIDSIYLEDLLQQFFDVQLTTSVSNAIDNGLPCVATIFNGGIGHEVMITGYKLSGMIEYFDSIDARYHQQNISQFYYMYTILAPY